MTAEVSAPAQGIGLEGANQAGPIRSVSVVSTPMTRSSPDATDARFARAAGALEVFLGVGALAGGVALMLGPRGEVLPLPVSALVGSPFDTYFVPGLILFVALGLGPLVAAGLAWRRHDLAPLAACAVGLALLVWLVVEIAIVGFSLTPPLQPLYLLLGAAITAVGIAWLRIGRRPSGGAA